MKICPSCQARYEDDKGFCRLDGAKLVSERAFAPEVVARRQLLEGRLAEEPENAGLLEELGDLLASVPIHDEALVQYFKALELDPENDRVRRKAVEVHRAKGEWSEAAKHLEVLVRKHPSDLDLLGALADVHVQGGRKPEAARVLARMTVLAPGDRDLWLRRRDLLQELRKDDELLAVFRRLTELEPEELSHWFGLVERLLAEEPEAQAQEWARVEGRLGKALPAPAGRRGALVCLYLVAARDRLGSARPADAALLRQADCGALEPSLRSLAARCYAALGHLALGSAEEEAVQLYASALGCADHAGARDTLTRIFLRRADSRLAGKSYVEAAGECERALGILGESPALLAKRKEALGKQRLRLAGRTLLVLVATAAAVLAYLYFGGKGPFARRPAREEVTKGQGYGGGKEAKPARRRSPRGREAK